MKAKDTGKKIVTFEEAIAIQRKKFLNILEEKLENLKEQIKKSPGEVRMDEHI